MKQDLTLVTRVVKLRAVEKLRGYGVTFTRLPDGKRLAAAIVTATGCTAPRDGRGIASCIHDFLAGSRTGNAAPPMKAYVPPKALMDQYARAHEYHAIPSLADKLGKWVTV